MPPLTEEQLHALGYTLGTWSAWFAFAGFLFALIRDLSQGKSAKHNPLVYLQVAGLAASIPPAFMLLYGGMIQPAVIPAVAGLRWPIVAAGALFLYTAIKGIIKP